MYVFNMCFIHIFILLINGEGQHLPFLLYIRQLKIIKTKKYILLNTFITSLCGVIAPRHRLGGWDVRGDPKAAGGCWATGHFVFRWRNFC